MLVIVASQLKSTRNIGTTPAINNQTTNLTINMAANMKNIFTLLLNHILLHLGTQNTLCHQRLSFHLKLQINVTCIIKCWHRLLLLFNIIHDFSSTHHHGSLVWAVGRNIDSCHGRVIGINNICFLCSSYCRSQATAA